MPKADKYIIFKYIFMVRYSLGPYVMIGNTHVGFQSITRGQQKRMKTHLLIEKTFLEIFDFNKKTQTKSCVAEST